MTTITKKITGKLTKSCLLFLSIALALSACGSDSPSSFDEGPQVRVVSPADNTTVAPGSTLRLELATSNFLFGPPKDSVQGHSGSHSSEGGHMTAQAQQPAASPGEGDGHYHIYLNEARDSDPHITAWDYEIDYEIPADMATGTHSLRIELRDNDHGAIGIEDVLFFNAVAE